MYGMKKKINLSMYVLSVFVYIYLIYPSIKWLGTVLSIENPLTNLEVKLTVVSVVILIVGLVSIYYLVAYVLNKIVINKWSDWGVRVLMVNICLEILLFIILYIFFSAVSGEISLSRETLENLMQGNIYLNILLQASASALIITGGIVSYKKGK